jgi:putative tryptophan/tyrosine transport system substrate-binding protein
MMPFLGSVSMERREFIMLLGGTAVVWPLAAHAQQHPKIPHVVHISPVDNPGRASAIRAQLRDLGYIEGRNMRLEFRNTEGNVGQLSALAERVVQDGVDVIVAESFPAAMAAYNAMQTIPIVAFVAADPVASGLAKSLARPGGNVTGVAVFAEETSVKRMEVMRELAPRAIRLAAVVTKVATSPRILGPIQESGGKLGFMVEIIILDDPPDLERELSLEVLSRFDGFVFPPDVVLAAHKAEVIGLIAMTKKPAIFFSPDWVDSGGLISFGPDFADAGRHLVAQLDRVLKGEKPGDLPFDRPTRFDLRINLITARAMGFEVPQTLLTRADKVIE